MRKIFTTYILVCCFALSASAQLPCGTDEVHNHRIQTDAAYRNHIINLEQEIQTAVQNQSNLSSSGRSTAYILPVVVHVIHIGEMVGTGSNISDAQIYSAIDGLNDKWRNVNGLGADLQVEFCLATVDPNGNPSTGINRVNGIATAGYSTGSCNYLPTSTCGGANPYAIKDLSRWSSMDYYNIWIVKSICEGYAGYAYFPIGDDYDGAVIAAQYFTSNDPTAAHELGHGFYLHHTFEGDGGNASCPPDGNCLLDGDWVCDTQPHKQNDCGATNPCTGSGTWNNSRYNYMSYCGTKNRFTSGQRDIVYATLQSWPRENLLLNNICVGSGINENTADASVAVYPNPASSELTVEGRGYSALKIKSVELFNTVGEKVCEKHLANGVERTAINIADFSSGIYFVTVTDKDGNKLRQKVVKF